LTYVLAAVEPVVHAEVVRFAVQVIYFRIGA
jgi:hypothetical protein